jgi:AsmA protein
LDKINLVVPSLGTVTGAGTVSPNNALDFKMVANLAGMGGGLTKAAGLGASGIPVAVGGTTSNPTFAPDLKAIANGKLKSLVPMGQNNPLNGLFGKKKTK